MPKFETKVIWDLNLDFQTNPDPEICRICPKLIMGLDQTYHAHQFIFSFSF